MFKSFDAPDSFTYICIQESWLCDDILSAELTKNADNLAVCRSDRKNSSHGGLVIFYPKAVPIGKCEKFETTNHQSQVLMTEFPTINVCVVNLYVVPLANYDLNETLKMFEIIDRFIEQFPNHATFLNMDHNNSELLFEKDPTTSEIVPVISNSPIDPYNIVDVSFSQHPNENKPNEP